MPLLWTRVWVICSRCRGQTRLLANRLKAAPLWAWKTKMLTWGTPYKSILALVSKTSPAMPTCYQVAHIRKWALSGCSMKLQGSVPATATSITYSTSISSWTLLLAIANRTMAWSKMILAKRKHWFKPVSNLRVKWINNNLNNNCLHGQDRGILSLNWTKPLLPNNHRKAVKVRCNYYQPNNFRCKSLDMDPKKLILSSKCSTIRAVSA